jgi:type IV secretory pathway TrbD component
MVTQKEKIMNEQIKAALDSYLRNLLGVVLALVTTTMANAGVASPLDFGLGEWLTVANGLWAAAVPTLIRYANKKDPAFGLVAETLAKGVTTKLETAAKAAPKAPAKKPAAKKTGSSGSKPTNQAQ